MFNNINWNNISVSTVEINGVFVESEDPREMNGAEYFRNMWNGVIDESGMDESGRDCYDEINKLKNGKRL